jgi:hypothetical protein
MRKCDHERERLAGPAVRGEPDPPAGGRPRGTIVEIDLVADIRRISQLDLALIRDS